jgi:sulfite exporter TauE/SafE
MDVAIRGLLLGLATGVSCLGSCLPVLFPLAVGEERDSIGRHLLLLSEFSAGRLAAYLVVGVLVGLVGQKVHGLFLHYTFGLITVALAIALVVWGLGRGGFSSASWCSAAARFAAARQFPALFGALTGFSLCPPFLLAINQALGFGTVGQGVAFFLAFFLATSVFFIPSLLLMPLARFQTMRWISQFAAILTGIIFFLIGIFKVLHTPI